jgi:hypothetical protein
MAKRRLSMRKIKEVLRLKWDHHLTNRQIARSCSIAHSTVREYLARAKLADLSWPLPSELDDAALENLLFPPNQPVPQERRLMPSMDYIHRERKKKGVTLQLLWYEYKQANPDGYQSSQFCALYRQWVQKLDICLRQEYRAGEKLFVDYAGQTIPINDPLTGEIRQAQLFVATLGASNYTFAEDPISTRLTRIWPSITVPLLSRQGPENPGIKPKQNQRSLSPNAGSWQPFGITASSASKS